MQKAALSMGMHPQVQTLLSMLGLQEERVAHPRVRDIDSRYDCWDDIEDYNHYIENINSVFWFKGSVLKVTLGRTATYIFRSFIQAFKQKYREKYQFQNETKICCRARRVDAPPRQPHAFANHFQQQRIQFAGKMKPNQFEKSYSSSKQLEGTNSNSFQGGGSRLEERGGGEPIGGEITPNCVCRCTCCPCCPCNPGEEDYLQYIDWKYNLIFVLVQLHRSFVWPTSDVRPSRLSLF